MSTGITPRRISLCLLLASLLTACGKPPEAAAPAGATLPSASAPIPTFTVSITAPNTSADLAQVKNQEIIHPQFALTPPEVDAPLLFASIRTPTQVDAPAILKKIGPAWRIAQLPGAQRLEWVYAAACPSRNELWAILDQAGDARAWQLTLLRSTDNGNTWSPFSAIKKPTNTAIFAGFALAKNGAGRLSMHLEDDADNQSHGYYHFHTADGGHTWTGPTLEVNDVAEADPFGEDDKLADAIKSTEAVPSTLPAP